MRFVLPFVGALGKAVVHQKYMMVIPCKRLLINTHHIHHIDKCVHIYIYILLAKSNTGKKVVLLMWCWFCLGEEGTIHLHIYVYIYIYIYIHIT